MALLVSATPLVRLSAQNDSASVRLSGYLQPRFQRVGNAATFLLRRARVAVEADITASATFRVQVEMRTTGAPATPPNSPLTISATDLHIRLHGQRWIGLVGQFRVPFSLESITSSGVLETTERALIVGAARRDIGVMGEWHVPDWLTVQAAVVNGEGPNRATNPDNRMAYMARVIATPTAGLDVGVAAVAYPDSTGVDVQGTFVTGRWKARAEFIREHLDPLNVYQTGWYEVATYLVRPALLQLVGRVEQIDPSDAATGDRVTGYLVGTQYFFSGDHLKLMVDYEMFREQGAQVDNDRAVIQMQARF